MKKFKIVFAFILIASSQLVQAQQDPQYSQYMFNQPAINPAFAGSKDALCAAFSTRRQWIDMPGAPLTNTLFVHGPLKSKSIGIGGHLVQESIGPKKWSGAYADFAYRFRFGKGKLALGISAGFNRYIFDLSKLNYQDNTESINTSVNAGVADFNTGFYFNNKSFYIGGSITHLNRAHFKLGANSEYNLEPHSYLYFGKGWQLRENLVFNPSVMIKSANPGTAQCDINFNFLIKQKLWLGASIRQNYGFVLLAQYTITDRFKIGYSFDRGLNRIGLYGKSSHELMLSYDFNIFKSKMISPRYL
jgi:type IX secretion system PorP/SprF family membrane protein